MLTKFDAQLEFVAQEASTPPREGMEMGNVDVEYLLFCINFLFLILTFKS